VTPLGLNGVGVIPLIYERNGLINGTVRVTLSVEILVRSLAVTDNRSAWFDPSIYNGLQGVSGSVRYWNKKCSASLTFETAEHPLALNRCPVLYRVNKHSLISSSYKIKTYWNILIKLVVTVA
jgi:hypothetical protein